MNLFESESFHALSLSLSSLSDDPRSLQYRMRIEHVHNAHSLRRRLALYSANRHARPYARILCRLLRAGGAYFELGPRELRGLQDAVLPASYGADSFNFHLVTFLVSQSSLVRYAVNRLFSWLIRATTK
jgi:hypothetical protein